jgi:hypothetical protein
MTHDRFQSDEILVSASWAASLNSDLTSLLASSPPMRARAFVGLESVKR